MSRDRGDVLRDGQKGAPLGESECRLGVPGGAPFWRGRKAIERGKPFACRRFGPFRTNGPEKQTPFPPAEHRRSIATLNAFHSRGPALSAISLHGTPRAETLSNLHKRRLLRLQTRLPQLRLTRKAIKALGLTAARFDMLTAIWRHPHGLPQSALRQELGVGRATISRMLGSLEDLGLVYRRVADDDRRQRIVRLTPEGLSSIGDAS